MDQKSTHADRDFNSISPSARSLILMKGYTTIPYARQTAELLAAPEPYSPDYSKIDFTYKARLLHFEIRYRSIDQLLEGTGITNILELSSGFSFRGLDAVNRYQCHYIDTDLPDMIEKKRSLMEKLQQGGRAPVGSLELLPLNALDETQFRAIVSRFPEGEIAIVNEGLLMYLSIEERHKVFAIIHKLLKERGGCWITADIYKRVALDTLQVHIDNKTKEFFNQHAIEDNKYDSFEQAKEIFTGAGFFIEAEAAPDPSQLSALPHFLENMPKDWAENSQKKGKIQATWRLRAV